MTQTKIQNILYTWTQTIHMVIQYLHLFQQVDSNE